MNSEKILENVRAEASKCLEVLANGRASRSARIMSRLGFGPSLPLQSVSGRSFLAARDGVTLSAVLSIVNRQDPGNQFPSCLIESGGVDVLRFDRAVIDKGDGDMWSAPAWRIGDDLARNLRLLKYAEWHSSDNPDGAEPTDILCDDPKLLDVGFVLLKDILAASGRTGDDQSLMVVLPTGSMPIELHPIGFEMLDINPVVKALSRYLPPALQVYGTGRNGAYRVSRIHARATAAGSSPMESLRATDRLLSALGPDRLQTILLR